MKENQLYLFKATWRSRVDLSKGPESIILAHTEEEVEQLCKTRIEDYYSNRKDLAGPLSEIDDLEVVKVTKVEMPHALFTIHRSGLMVPTYLQTLKENW